MLKKAAFPRPLKSMLTINIKIIVYIYIVIQDSNSRSNKCNRLEFSTKTRI